MRFPSLFRLPRHQQFQIQPRYYDPIKEDIEKRKKRIKRELMKRKNRQEDSEEDEWEEARFNISEAFARKRKAKNSAGFLQFFMMILFLGTGFGYIYFGNEVLYILLIMLPIFMLVRLKNIY